MQRPAKEGMTNFLTPEEVPGSTQAAPHCRDFSACIHRRACKIPIESSRAQPVVVSQRGNWDVSRVWLAVELGEVPTPRACLQTITCRSRILIT